MEEVVELRADLQVRGKGGGRPTRGGGGRGWGNRGTGSVFLDVRADLQARGRRGARGTKKGGRRQMCWTP